MAEDIRTAPRISSLQMDIWMVLLCRRQDGGGSVDFCTTMSDFWPDFWSYCVQGMAVCFFFIVWERVIKCWKDSLNNLCFLDVGWNPHELLT